MKYLILFLLVPIASISQNKGASPIAGSQEPTANKNTYAVVIGISDYQDDKIPDLRYADKDAEAFANFLRSPARIHLKEPGSCPPMIKPRFNMFSSVLNKTKPS